FLTVLQTVLDRPAAPWVRSAYLRRFQRYLENPLWYWYYDEELEQVVALLGRLPDGAELARLALAKVKAWHFTDDARDLYRSGEEPFEGLLVPEARPTARRPELLAALRCLGEHRDGAPRPAEEEHGLEDGQRPAGPG